MNGFRGQSNVLIPLKNSRDSIFYTDFRSRLSNDEASEWNLGLGYRKKSDKDDNRLSGIYVYKDRRDEFDHTWDMWTVGGEILANSYDIRFNGYIADNKKVAVPQRDTVVVRDQKIIYQEGYYQSMDGIDLEFGERFIDREGPLHNMGVYFKIYKFFADGTEDMNGNEISINKLVGNREKTNYKFGVEWREDNIRGSHVKASFEVSILFGGSNNKDEENEKEESETDVIETRMTEKPKRDIDIVIGESKTGKNKDSGTVAYDPVTDNKLDDTEYISADTEDIVTKINDSRAKVIILLGDRGEMSLDGSIELDEGQKLLSPTGSLLVSAETKGSRATYFEPEGEQAQLNFKSYNGDGSLVLKKHNTVSGVKIVNNSNAENSAGIYKESLDVDNVPDIRDNFINDFDIGIYFEEIKGETDQNKLNHLARFNAEYENLNEITGVNIVDVHDHIVKDWYDLDAIRYNKDGAYLMKADLNFDTAGYEELASDAADTGDGWVPIGRFTGAFDGNARIISKLNINRGESGFDIGLFGVNEGAINNLALEGIDVTGDNTVGGLEPITEI